MCSDKCFYGFGCEGSPRKENINEATVLTRLANHLGMSIVIKEMILLKVRTEQLNFSGNA